VKVGLYSGVLQRCPPDGYGAEVATWDLARALACLGHTVTLAAPAGSRVPPGGSLVEIPLVAENGSPGGSWVAAEKGAAPDVVEAMRGCDVIHDLSCSTQVHVAACGPRGECAIPHSPGPDPDPRSGPRRSRPRPIAGSGCRSRRPPRGRGRARPLVGNPAVGDRGVPGPSDSGDKGGSVRV